MSGVFIPVTEELIEAIAARVVEMMADNPEPESGVAENKHTWLNVKHAAQHLDCPESRIYDLVALGELAPERDGRRLLFTRADLDAYVYGRNQRTRRST
jgi:excisionase family DNA binding protein